MIDNDVQNLKIAPCLLGYEEWQSTTIFSDWLPAGPPVSLIILCAELYWLGHPRKCVLYKTTIWDAPTACTYLHIYDFGGLSRIVLMYIRTWHTF